MTEKELETKEKFFKQDADKTGHIGLKILGVLAIAAGFLILLGGVFLSALGGILATTSTMNAICGLPIFILGLVVISLAVFAFWYGRSLYKERKWAYYFFYGSAIAMTIISAITLNIVGVIIGVVFWLYARHIGREIDKEMCEKDSTGRILCASEKPEGQIGGAIEKK